MLRGIAWWSGPVLQLRREVFAERGLRNRTGRPFDLAGDAVKRKEGKKAGDEADDDDRKVIHVEPRYQRA